MDKFFKVMLVSCFIWGLVGIFGEGTGALTAEQTFARGGAAGFAQSLAAETLPAKSSQAPRLEKHGGRGIACDACHGAVVPPVAPPTEKCFSCHGSHEALASKTAGHPNPHKSHLGELDCDKCHKEHGKSVFFCNKCHVFTMEVP